MSHILKLDWNAIFAFQLLSFIHSLIIIVSKLSVYSAVWLAICFSLMVLCSPFRFDCKVIFLSLTVKTICIPGGTQVTLEYIWFPSFRNLENWSRVNTFLILYIKFLDHPYNINFHPKDLKKCFFELGIRKEDIFSSLFSIKIQDGTFLVVFLRRGWFIVN